MIRMILCTAVISGFMASTVCSQDKTELAKEWLKVYEGEWTWENHLESGGEIGDTTEEGSYEVVAGGNALIGKTKSSVDVETAWLMRLDEDGNLMMSGATSRGLLWTTRIADISEKKMIGKAVAFQDGNKGEATVHYKLNDKGQIVEEGDAMWAGQKITWRHVATKKK